MSGFKKIKGGPTGGHNLGPKKRRLKIGGPLRRFRNRSIVQGGDVSKLSPDQYSRLQRYLETGQHYGGPRRDPCGGWCCEDSDGCGSEWMSCHNIDGCCFCYPHGGPGPSGPPSRVG